MQKDLPLSVVLLFVSLAVSLLVAGCDSLGASDSLTEEPEKGTELPTEELSLFESTNDLGSRMTSLDGAIKMQPSGLAKAAPDIELTSIARVEPPGDTTRASHLTFNSGKVFAGYKALGNPFKGGIDFLDATDPTTPLDINSLGSESLDVQEVAYNFDNKALYVAGALDLSTTARTLEGTPALVAKVTNFQDPESRIVGLTDNVGKSVITAPEGDIRHDVYVATDEQAVYRFNEDLEDQVRQEIEEGEIRSIAATENTVFAVDRGASLHQSDVGSTNPFSKSNLVGSGVGDLAIGRLHARKKNVLNGDRLFLALGSEGLAVVDAQSGNLLFRRDRPYYTSVTLHQDDPTVDEEPNELVYAARENGLMDIYKVADGGIDTGDQNTGLEKVGTFDLSELDGVSLGDEQVNQVLGVGCHIYLANSTEGIVILQIGNGKSCALQTGPENQPPTAKDDSDTTTEDTPTTTDVLVNDSDSDGSLDPATVTVTSGPSDGGTSVNTSTGEITYTPSTGFKGEDSYKYTVDDNDGATSNTATVSITVNATNAPPTIDPIDDQTVDEGSSLTVQCSASDPDGDALTISQSGLPEFASFTDNGDGTCTFTFDPGNDDQGTYTITVTAKDPSGASDSTTFDVTVNDTCAKLQPDKFLSGSISGGTATVQNTDPNCSYEVGLAVYKMYDNNIPPGEDITQILHDSDTKTVGPDDSVTLEVDRPSCDYQIDLFYGEVIESFDDGEQYDGRLLDASQVDNGGFCGPKAIDDAASTDESTPVTIDVAANDTDGDGNLDPSSVSIVSGPSNGTVANNGDGTVTYTPDSGFSGTDSFVYDICDEDDRCASLIDEEGTVTITVNDSNQPPTAKDDSDDTDKGESVTTDVVDNDTDPDGNLDDSSVQVAEDPDHGDVDVKSNGEIEYTPDASFTGTDTYKYTVADTDGARSNAAKVEIEVKDVTSAPTPPSGAKAISFAAFCTTERDFDADDIEITDTITNEEDEVLSIAWESDVTLSTVVLKSGMNMYNYPGGTSGGAASEAGDPAGNGQSPSSPCPNGETQVVKMTELDDGGDD